MNNCVFIGRLVRDPEIRYGEGETPLMVARYTLAVDRESRNNGQQAADFLSFVAFGKTAEFVEKYLKKGIKIAVTSRAQSGSYTKKDGTKVYYTEFLAQKHEFVESKKDNTQEEPPESDGFMNIPDDIDEELPFN